MPAPISVEVRERVVSAHKAGKGSYAELAELFQVGAASVSRWLRLARESGTLVPKPVPGKTPKLDERGRQLLRQLVKEDSDATLSELSERLFTRHKVKLSPSTIHKVLDKMDISRKKKTSTRRSATAKTFDC
jgi:transposase